MLSNVVTHNFRKTAITRRPNKLQTPNLDHFALHWMAIRWSHSMFQWQMFKWTYIDFNILCNQKWWQKQWQQCVWSACAPSKGLLETYLKVHSHDRDHSCTQTKFHVDLCRDSQDYPVTKNTDGRTDGFSALYIVD